MPAPSLRKSSPSANMHLACMAWHAHVLTDMGTLSSLCVPALPKHRQPDSPTRTSKARGMALPRLSHSLGWLTSCGELLLLPLPQEGEGGPQGGSLSGMGLCAWSRNSYTPPPWRAGKRLTPKSFPATCTGRRSKLWWWVLSLPLPARCLDMGLKLLHFLHGEIFQAKRHVNMVWVDGQCFPPPTLSCLHKTRHWQAWDSSFAPFLCLPSCMFSLKRKLWEEDKDLTKNFGIWPCPCPCL